MGWKSSQNLLIIGGLEVLVKHLKLGLNFFNISNQDNDKLFSVESKNRVLQLLNEAYLISTKDTFFFYRQISSHQYRPVHCEQMRI